MGIYADARHGVVCSVEDSRENYFGWPSVAKLGDGTIVAASSGLRRAHVCPWGKSVLNYSNDGGETFGAPVIAHNDMIDDRDMGVIAMGGQKFAITWFTEDDRENDLTRALPEQDCKEAMELIKTWDDDTVSTLLGSWIMITEDGGNTWTRPIRVPVSTPHGFICLKNGDLGYLGKGFDEERTAPLGPVRYCVSHDGGFTWEIRGDVPIPEGMDVDQFHEPHVIELKDGRLMGAVRVHMPRSGNRGGYDLDVALTVSDNDGKTWSVPRLMNFAGSPPHLMRHSSGAIVLSYGYRHPGYGQRARVSYDEGESWSGEIIIRDDGETGDLGYPCSIEMDDGSVYTVYYQALPHHSNTSILWSRWKLPER